MPDDTSHRSGACRDSVGHAVSCRWGQCAKGAEYEQPNAVKRRYPDPPVRFDTPDVFIDAHEFSVATRWIEKFNAVQAYEFTMAYASHPSVDGRLTDLAERVFSRNIARDGTSAGYTHFWYYTTAYSVKDKRVAGGGTAPDARDPAGIAVVRRGSAVTTWLRPSGLRRTSTRRRRL
jgi:hypothetical protein